MRLSIEVDDERGVEVFAGEERIDGVEAVRFTHRRGQLPTILLAMKGCFEGSFSAEVASTPAEEPEPEPEPKGPVCL